MLTKAAEIFQNRPKKTLKEKFSEKNLLDYQKEDIRYYSKDTEILARKAVFDDQLEQLGIKKYEEEFTKEHYEKVQELLNNNKLDDNSVEFFRSFEKESLIMIMNCISENNIDMDNIENMKSNLIDTFMEKIESENSKGLLA